MIINAESNVPLQTLSEAYRNTKQRGMSKQKHKCGPGKNVLTSLAALKIGQAETEMMHHWTTMSSVSHLRHVIIRSFFCVLHSGALSLSPSSSPMGIVLYAPIRRGRSLLPLLEAYLLRWGHCTALACSNPCVRAGARSRNLGIEQ